MKIAALRLSHHFREEKRPFLMEWYRMKFTANIIMY